MSCRVSRPRATASPTASDASGAEVPTIKLGSGPALGRSRTREAAVELALSSQESLRREAPWYLRLLNQAAGVESEPPAPRSVELALAALRRSEPADGLVGLRPGLEDAAYDGAWLGRRGVCYRSSSPLLRVPPTKPLDGCAVRHDDAEDTCPARIIYVNGVRNRVQKQALSLAALANTLGADCVGIHVASAGPSMDLLTAVAERFRVRESAAVATLEGVLRRELEGGAVLVRIVAHSLGAVIVARALERVANSLSNIPEGRERLSRIEVTTLGGAERTFPPGPKYRHFINEHDPVAMTLGLGRGGASGDAGPGAEIVGFSDEGDGSLLSRHGMVECHLLRLHGAAR